MNPSEAAQILAVAVTLDPRLKPPTAEDAQFRAMVWAETLDPDMNPGVARRLVTDHYRESTTGIMPADLNRLWRQFRKDQMVLEREERERNAIAAADAMAVPMPEDVRRQLQEVLEGKHVPHE